VKVDGVFIKHDFDHIMLDPEELDKFTHNELSLSTLKQSMMIPYIFDIQVLVYFLKSHFPSVDIVEGEDEINATMIESGYSTKQKKKKYDMKILVKSHIDLNQNPKIDKVNTMTLKYYYSAQMMKVSWITTPKNDLVADSICLLILEIKERATPQLLKMIDLTKQGRQQ
jgi:hypothetical protein